MKTITFYSYKGGVGRTLLLANIARYLAKFGQKVFVMDFDLEAPGLHYKLGVPNATDQEGVRQGIVDYLHSFVQSGIAPSSLQDYVIEVAQQPGVSGSIHLMPAGNILTAQYWQRLSQIDWHGLFYTEDAIGIPLFLELKAYIEQEYAPDFLLIDSRTGITEMGGIATTILPDSLVCLLIRNRENLEGAREVLRGVQRTLRQRQQPPIDIVPVVARIPEFDDPNIETGILAEIRNFLNADAPELADTLDFSNLSVLHIDRSIEIEESLLVEGNRTTDQSSLLRDYLRLFAHLTPPSIIQNQIVPLIEEALHLAWDDPPKAEQNLLALTETQALLEPFEALIKFYRLRNAGEHKCFEIALRCWQVTRKADSPLLWEVVQQCVNENTIGSFNNLGINFILDVWQNAGRYDLEFAERLAQHNKYSERMIQIVEILLENREASHQGFLQAIQLLMVMYSLRQGHGVQSYNEILDRNNYLLENASTYLKTPRASETEF